MALALNDVLADPVGAACVIRHSERLYGVLDCTGRTVAGGAAAAFEVALRPLPVLEDAGFPIMHCRIVVLPDGDVWAFPRHAAGQQFFHRNGIPATLCLEWRDDDPALRWCWADGLEQYVGRVHRHLCWEEQWRRTGRWPVEDAPHGAVVPALPATRDLEAARRRWCRS